MTVDIRAAARDEAFMNHYSHKQVPDRYDADLLIEGFQAGAVWAQAQLTPTREQIAKMLEQHMYDPGIEMCSCGWDQNTAPDSAFERHQADAVVEFAF